MASALLALMLTISAELLQVLSYNHSKTGKHGFQTQPSLEEKYFTQTLDHFNLNSMGNGTYLQRYLITDKYWKIGYGPIFFYTGNEGDIWQFALNSGFLLELAALQEALVIFAEHRYYGKSLPFGNDSFNIPEVGLLTVEQALADYAVMISVLKRQMAAADCPVVVFGGSYGGMLSVYMRIKYPNLVAGALAASAPILSTAGLGEPTQFFRDVTADFENISPECRCAVEGAFHQLKELCESQDYSKIQSAFSLCKRPSSAQDIHHLNGLLRNAFTLMAMLDYPYSTHFMGNLPANPVKVGCETMLRGGDLLANLRDTAAIVYNSTGLLTCFDLYSLYVECADPTGCGLGFDSVAWDYQACTEINLCYESNNITDMFPAMTFTERERLRYCSKRWGVIPRPALSRASNIIFSNGDLDPWANGGVSAEKMRDLGVFYRQSFSRVFFQVRKSLSSSLIAINIAGGAHHLDLRGSNDADPASVIEARKTEADLITQWVELERKQIQQLP
ncbi:dipeptidyl peptidase 2 isoform X2 [Phycodurus eques]|uniref:dipeptidyl peptidase 2 isoform X2 n=1 Tax=Phycodurus eques TaxID=693459 RepID=UPI002ACEBC70|nr:dipeptidyl peptidase 2 isoform X2 [Phycodurus eques]